jgi:sugar-specific transcriptional regulator TrmB
MSATAPLQPQRRERENVDALVALGLTATEARVYLARVAAAPAAASATASAAGVARPKVYEALRSLEERGFCTRGGTEVVSYAAVDPAIALPAWAAQRDAERRMVAERDADLVARLVKTLPRPVEQPAEPLSSYMEAVFGRARTGHVIETVVGRTERTLCMIQQPPFVQARARWNVAEVEAARRGVKVRIIYTAEAMRDPHRYVPVLEAGAEVRVSSDVPMKLLVRDELEAFISLRDPLTGEQGVTSALIRHPDLVRPLQLLFNREWRRARRVRSDALPGEGETDVQLP